MNDKELTELAAKAFGVAAEGFSPLTDDGDALRLAGTLDMQVTFEHDASRVLAVADGGKLVMEQYNGDCHGAARRAIVRAAAEAR